MLPLSLYIHIPWCIQKCPYCDFNSHKITNYNEKDWLNAYIKQINYFNEYSTLTYDLLGHGKTPCNKDKLNLKDFSNQLLEILEHLKIEKINLIGFSLGSLIALDFSSNFQEKVEKLILIGTTYKRSVLERSLVLDRYNQAKLNSDGWRN